MAFVQEHRHSRQEDGDGAGVGSSGQGGWGSVLGHSRCTETRSESAQQRARCNNATATETCGASTTIPFRRKASHAGRSPARHASAATHWTAESECPPAVRRSDEVFVLSGRRGRQAGGCCSRGRRVMKRRDKPRNSANICPRVLRALPPLGRAEVGANVGPDLGRAIVFGHRPASLRAPSSPRASVYIPPRPSSALSSIVTRCKMARRSGRARRVASAAALVASSALAAPSNNQFEIVGNSGVR